MTLKIDAKCRLFNNSDIHDHNVSHNDNHNDINFIPPLQPLSNNSDNYNHERISDNTYNNIENDIEYSSGIPSEIPSSNVTESDDMTIESEPAYD